MDMFDMEENGGIMILQTIIIVLALIIVYMLYSDTSTTKMIEEKVNNFKCPECPAIPECPDCNCRDGSTPCPDCICDRDSMECPACPKCPDAVAHAPTVDEIVNAIFPGRNSGITAHGDYFPVTGLEETTVEPAYSPVINMIPGEGTPSAVSFQDEMLMNQGGSVGLASQVSPPMGSGSGVFTEPSSVASDGGAERKPEPSTGSDSNTSGSNAQSSGN